MTGRTANGAGELREPGFFESIGEDPSGGVIVRGIQTGIPEKIALVHDRPSA
jgi:hypothetical protein